MQQQNPGDKAQQAASSSLEQAEKLFQAGKLGEAEVLLRTLLKTHPANADALFALGLIAHAANKSDAAIRLIDEAIEINPKAGRFHTNIAAMYAKAGDLAKAIEHGRIAVALKPKHSESHNNLGVALLATGDTSSAIAHFSKAIELDPKNTDALANRSNAYSKKRETALAEADARNAVAANPKSAAAHNSLAAVLLVSVDFPGAESAARTALTLVPGDFHAMLNLTLALKAQRKSDAALALANQTLQLFPSSGEAMCIAATVHIERKNFETARRLIDQSLAMNPDGLEAVITLGRLQFETQQPHKAIETLRRAIALDPRHPDAQNLLGCALREIGEFDEAIRAFDKCIAIDPGNFGAYANISETKTFQSRDDSHLKAMLALASTDAAQSEDQRMQLQFAIGKALDDLNDFDAAFEHVSKACRIKRAQSAYSEADTLGLFERIQRLFTPEIVSKFEGKGNPTKLPIFVLGMPRSGTTLIEQIITSHPIVKGAGEVRDVHDALVDVRNHVSGHRPYPEFLPDAESADLTYFGQSVAKRLSTYWPQSLRITDKMPSNFFFLGLLRLAMPNAKFIHARRNPADTCLSCYFKLFSGEINFTYDLEELGRYYSAYDKLMQHWRSVLPAGSFLDVDYENVVSDIEGQARRILDYCGLEWDPAVLEFHRSERPIKTASAVQIRQPIYGSSVARWRNYEKHLGPLLKELGSLAHRKSSQA
ncbi:MAG: sulfotransferase [Micropepsaceae bacterium]